MKDGKVPESFPGTVAIIDDKVNNTLLHPGYRRYKDGHNDDFEYFVTRLLAKLSPLRTGFRTRKKEQLISDIFTVTDEAFVLFVFYNELECWQKQKSDIDNNGLSGRNLVKAKKFCNGRSGNREGWSKTGLDLFRKLVGEVKYRRDESKKFEEEMRARMAVGKKDTCETPTQNLVNMENSNRNKYLVADDDDDMISDLMAIL